MKKLLYSLMTAVIALTSCTTWDDPKTENYGEGPSIEVSIAAVAPTDSAFVVSIVPGAGTTYYAFVMDANDEAETLDAATLLKGGYGNNVVNTSKYPSLTIPVDGMEPNTTYQVYAVASNEKGIIGKISVASIKTTDSGKPTPASFTADASAKTAKVTFNQAIGRSEGKVSGIYYKEWDWDNPVALTEDDIEVVVSGKTATFTTADVPAGAYVLISWEEGAFVDAVGNKCPAFTSTYNEATDKFTGVNFRVQTANWAITDANVTSPKSGSTFPKWSEFEGTITFENDVYVVDEDLKAGDFTVTYTNDSRTVTYKLATTDWSLAADKKTVTFKLPKATEPGDRVTVAIKGGVFYDVYGNVNNAYSSENVYWIAFAMKKEDVLGTFDFIYYDYFSSGAATSGGTVTIEEDPDNENGLIISGMFVSGLDLKGYYNLDECKMYIYNFQKLGALGTYYASFENAMAYDDVAFDVVPNSMTSEDYFGLYAYQQPDYSDEGLGWLRLSVGGLFVRKEAAQVSRRANAKPGNWTPVTAFKHTKRAFRK